MKTTAIFWFATVLGLMTLRLSAAPLEEARKAFLAGDYNATIFHAKAATGVDYVSVGRLTQSAPAADIGLDFSAA